MTTLVVARRIKPWGLFQSCRREVPAGSSVVLFAPQRSANLGQGMECGNFARRDHVRGFGEIVPHKLLHVRLDDDVRLSAPGEVRMALHDVERTAEDIGKRARLTEIP